MNKKNKLVLKIGSFTAGLLNGLLGSAGGMVLIPLLKYTQIETKKAHATCIAMILPICIASSVIYYISGNIEFSNYLFYIPSGLVGAIIGTFILPKIPPKVLSKIFALFMLWAGFRLVFRW